MGRQTDRQTDKQDLETLSSVTLVAVRVGTRTNTGTGTCTQLGSHSSKSSSTSRISSLLLGRLLILEYYINTTKYSYPLIHSLSHHSFSQVIRSFPSFVQPTTRSLDHSTTPDTLLRSRTRPLLVHSQTRHTDILNPFLPRSSHISR